MQAFDAKVLRQGQLQTVRVNAIDDAEARRRLQADGAQVLSLHRRASLGLRTRKPKFALSLFIQELVVLLDAGLVLVESVETLRDKAPPGSNRQVLEELVQAMHQGQPFSRALEAQPAIFPPLLVATVASSEHSGQLATALRRYHHYEAHLETVRKRVSGALVYPMVVLSIGGLILLFLLFFVIPRFSAVFANMAELPATAKAMLWWSGVVRDHGGKLFLGAIAAVVGLVLLFRSAVVKQQLMAWFWRLPRLGEQRHLFVLARFYRTLGMLLAGGMAVVPSIELVGGLLPAERQRDLQAALVKIKAGQTLSSTLGEHALTTPVAERLLRVGEQSGELPAMCERIAQFHDEALARAIEMFSKIFEPVLMLVVGALIGVIVFLLYMPIFELAGSISE